MAADGSFGTDNNDLSIPGCGCGSFSSRFDDTDNRDMRCGADSIECEGRRSIAGDHQQLGALGLEIVRSFDRVACHGFDRLGSVGQAGGIAELGVVGRWNIFK